MPVTKSAAKAARQNLRRYKRNLKLKNRVKGEVKALIAAIAASDTKATTEKLKTAQSTLDKAAKTGVIHANKAARQKSRLAKLASGKTKAATTTSKAQAKPILPTGRQATKATPKPAPKTAAKKAS